MKKIIFLIFFCWKGLLSPANTYYISLTGNDENSGLNPSESWLTVDKVNSFSFQPGDSILFMGGETFNGNIDKVTGSGGSNGNPVTFSSYGSGKATISSGKLEGIYIGSGDVVVKNLIFQGAGYMATSMWVSGMDFQMDANVTSNFDNISVDSVEDLYEELSKNAIEFVQSLRDMPYGKEFYVADPDGNIIGFLEEL